MSDNFSTGNNNNPMISAAKGAAVGGVVGGASAYICGGYLKTSNNPLITDVNGFVLRCDKYAKALNKKYDRLTQKLESL